MTTRQPLSNANGRIAIVDGLRTPFARIATHYRDLSAIDLGVIVVNELIRRNQLKKEDIDQLIFGMTVMIPEAPFIAREIALACGLDDVDAYSITRACATSFQTIASGAESILAGNAEVVIAGGTDSTSSVRLPMSSRFSATMRDVNFAKTLKDRMKLLSTLRPKDLLPMEPSITEFSVGETMGQSCEKMVKKCLLRPEEMTALLEKLLASGRVISLPGGALTHSAVVAETCTRVRGISSWVLVCPAILAAISRCSRSQIFS